MKVLGCLCFFYFYLQNLNSNANLSSFSINILIEMEPLCNIQCLHESLCTNPCILDNDKLPLVILFLTLHLSVTLNKKYTKGGGEGFTKNSQF